MKAAAWRTVGASLCSIFIVCCLVLIGPGPASSESVKPKQATEATKAHNAKLLELLPFANKQDVKDATRGFIAPLPNNGVINNDKGQPVWDMRNFQFILDQEKAPDTVNPSLWRQSRLVMQGGLFKVVDGLYQVRNADLSNLTIYEGKTGIILADPLVSAETAKAALELYYQHRPRKPVVAVVFSHATSITTGECAGWCQKRTSRPER
jgi:alkyl sulfatase BDS1-like metallo-beta-lactamase superfamily hydrolase